MDDQLRGQSEMGSNTVTLTRPLQVLPRQWNGLPILLYQPIVAHVGYSFSCICDPMRRTLQLRQVSLRILALNFATDFGCGLAL